MNVATRKSIVNFITEQLAGAGTIQAKPMFGEYGLYCDGKLTALICDDQLFVKPTPSGEALVGDIAWASPYPGAKPIMLIPGDRWDDPEWLSNLIKITSSQLLAPKPKRGKSK